MNNEFLFIFLLCIFFEKIKTQTCGSKNPENFTVCNMHSNTDSLCCYAEVSLLNENNTMCILVPRSQSFITPYITALDVGMDKNYIKMKIDCGNVTRALNQAYSLCKPEPPKNPEDCFAHSQSNSSCCYIESPDGNKVCLFNDGVYDDDDTYFGTRIYCAGSFIKNKILIVLLYSFLFFNFI